MKLFFGAYIRTVRERNRERTAAKKWEARARYLEQKLDDRSDLFIEREQKLIDRFLTSQVKTFAITDEIAAKKITQQDVDESDFDNFKNDKIDFLEQCAREAGEPHPRDRAIADFNANYGLFRQEFEGERAV